MDGDVYLYPTKEAPMFLLANSSVCWRVVACCAWVYPIVHPMRGPRVMRLRLQTKGKWTNRIPILSRSKEKYCASRAMTMSLGARTGKK